jgi:oxygen-dependent protoporphyrinogen oxidase
VSARVVIVGGGISGLAAAWRLKLRRPEAAVIVLEAAARFGGKLVTEHRDGFIVEGAADGFLARKPPALDWARELGLDTELVLPRAEHRFSQVYWNGVLHPMPEGFSGLVPADPDALLKTTLLTPEGAARAAAEPAVPLRSSGPEESIAAFFTRRFGTELFERLLEPLLAGIYAGDASRLSADAAFPQLTALERSGKPLMNGALSTGPRDPAFRSFVSGMAALPSALESRLRALGVELVAGATVSEVRRAETGFTIETPRSSHSADAVIVALPPRAAGAVLGAGPAADVLSSWPVSSVANVSLAFDGGELDLPDGSGFVAPRGAASVTAGTWSGHKWPHRSPEGAELVRFYFGGAREPENAKLPDDELVGRSLTLLETLTGRRPRPRWHRIFRWKDAFAQPDLGHAERHRGLEAAAVPGLVLAGGYFAGVGIPDCLARAGQAAEAVDEHLETVENYL